MNLASRRISKMRLRSKLLWSYLIANILVFVLGIVGLSVMTQSSTDKAIDDVQGNFEETCLMFSNRMNLNYMVLDIVYSDQYFIRQLQREYSSVSDYFTGYFELILGTVSRKNIMLSDNTRVEIFGDNPTIVYDGYILRKLDSKVKNQPWYDSVIAGQGVVSTCGPYREEKDNAYVVLGRCLSDVRDLNTFVMSIRISNTFFRTICDSSKLVGDVHLLDSDGRILFSRSEELLGQNFFDLYPMLRNQKTAEPLFQGNEIVLLDYLSANVSTEHLMLASVLPQSVINEQTRPMTIWYYVIFVGAILLSVLIITIFISHICRRIDWLNYGMECVQKGEYNIRVAVEGEDELAKLCQGFNRMTNQINILINEQYALDRRMREFEYKKKEAELLSLQSQINPHFLVNFLEAIRVRLIRDGNDVVAGILLNFTKLLRRSIDWQVDRVAISEELHVVKEYLEMQVFRYREKIVYDIQCDKSLEQIVIPKFLIQPLVENSIFHGVENIIGQGCISVRVLPDGEDHLVISVSDNGAGIQEEYLRQLQDQIMSDELINHSTNVGIMNVAQRIKLFYGEQYHLEIKSQVGKGTVVRMRLPVKIPESEVIRTSPYREVKKDEKI